MDLIFTLLLSVGAVTALAIPCVLIDRTLRARRGLPPRDWLYVADPHAGD